MLDWQEHPMFPGSYFAVVDKYSFMCLRDQSGGDFFETSWQDRYKGGSASNTREGPFKKLEDAQANCERILRELERKQ